VAGIVLTIVSSVALVPGSLAVEAQFQIEHILAPGRAMVREMVK
jgi:hypothetical protein